MSGDALLGLLGRGADEAAVQDALAHLARGMQPELDPEDEEDYIDWVTVNEIGLECGFEDEAYLKAWDPELRRQGRLLLSQLYFYGETDDMEAFPHPLPLGLTFGDDRTVVRERLYNFEDTRRSYIRDVWRLPEFLVTVAYRTDGLLDSVLCQLEAEPWPPPDGPQPPWRLFPPEKFVELFGLRWSHPQLRDELAAFDIDHRIGEIRSEHTADLRFTHGIELMFTEGHKLKRGDRRRSHALALGAVTYYASRELDARQWSGSLPFDLTFDDDQMLLLRRVGAPPAHQEDDEDEDLKGLAVWHFDDFTLSVMYSNVENRIRRVTLMDPGY